MSIDRRHFLKTLAGSTALGASTLHHSIARALSIPAKAETGSILDVKHVVIFMQENRSFDHYFGCLRGVRGFGDPRPSLLRNGKPVWYQPMDNGKYQLPFALKGFGDSAEDRSQCQPADLPHNWKYSQKMWAHYDVWVKEKTSMSMGYLTRDDLPFYYALADAFTIGDAYHASVFGPTDPNRLFLFSGTNGVSVGKDGRHALSNVDDGNETASMLLDKPNWKSPYTWTTYAERLSAQKVTWKVYQEYDNFGDNALAYFPQFRNLNRNDAAQEELYQRARAYAGETAERDDKGLPRNRERASTWRARIGSYGEIDRSVARTIAARRNRDPRHVACRRPPATSSRIDVHAASPAIGRERLAGRGDPTIGDGDGFRHRVVDWIVIRHL